jgi:hypothetical protein
MRSITISLLALFLIAACHSERESLFNGKDLEGWTIFVDDPSVNPEEFFYVTDGVIETVGVPNGYLRTIKSYADYHLHVEWRYPDQPVNSGVFVHTSGPDLLWPTHYQGQLKHGFAGDFIVHGVGEVATIRDTVYTSSQDVKPVVPKEHPSNENPAGEWNSYDIICKGDRVELRVNGLLQNVATNCSLTSGNIGLQAEGSRIQFRNLWIEPVK